MTKKALISEKLPISNLPFSHGFLAGRFVFTSGQVGVNPQTGQLATGIEAQTKQTLANVEAVLMAAGFTKHDVVKATVFLADIRDYNAMNEVYSAFFNAPYPARSCVEAKLANPKIRVEIEAIAYRA
ncbi:MAG: RidA family protein [Candidatus Bathyarchaeota archaeon]|nr:MAG: RidA family protein [Candidatus Bathyarchaeota archaeon]